VISNTNALGSKSSVQNSVKSLKSRLRDDIKAIRLKYVMAKPITDGPHLTPEFTTSGVPFLSVDGIQDGELVFENCRFISEQDHCEFSKKASPQYGDILLGKAASTGKIARVKKDIEFSIWSPLALIRPNLDLISSAFLESSLKSLYLQAQIDDLCSFNTQKNISMGAIPTLVLPLPSLDEQVKITDYIDRETTEIDALVAEKENMLALIEEKREALISHTVTSGINPNAPLKPSNLGWLGDVPKHWKLERAKGLFREVDDRTTTGEEELLSLRMQVGLVPHHDVSNKILEPKDVVGFKKVETGQLVINRMRASMGLIAVSPQNGLVSPDYAVFDIVKPIYIPYFLALFNTTLVGALFRSASKGLGTGSSGFLRLYSENFLSIHFPVPPLDEQRQIVDFLDRDCEKTGELEKALTNSIILLRERRSALITAAVTGQIEPEDMRR
jgi:type I restriction enzyme, S subunit